MKRDMDLIRKILMETEERGGTSGWIELNLDNYPNEQVVYHVRLLAEAGLIEAQDLSTFSGMDWRPKALTWQGHEFLDKARNESVWAKTKAIVSEKGGSISLDVLQSLLTKVAMEWFGLS